MKSNTYYAGVDIGSAFAKAVILADNKIASWAILPSRGDYKLLGEEVLKTALTKAGIAQDQIQDITATGYGAGSFSGAGEAVSDITCHGIGTHFLFPSVRTVIDIGSQFSRVFRIDAEGNPMTFVLSEKCAAGSGRLLQVIARVLQVEMADMGELALKSKIKIEFTTSCAVFNESEVVSRIAEGATKEDIIDGIHRSLASKVETLVERVKFEPDCSLVGGCGKNAGLIKRIEERLNIQLFVYPEPQIVAALGAALLAQSVVERRRND